jgi:glycosyltransferase involved in cell wall biosynthesis
MQIALHFPIRHNPVMQDILYYCFDWKGIHGGTQVIYQNVTALNELGFNARVLHVRSGFRYDWFDNNAPIVYLDTMDSRALKSSVIVVPESFGPGLHQFLPGPDPNKPIDISSNKVVIFNQAYAYTFINWGFEQKPVASPYTGSNVLGTITCSEYNCNYLKYVFPGSRIFLKSNSIDGNVYYPEAKENLILLLIRKNRIEIENVLWALQLRGALSGFRIQIINEMSKADLARLLRKTAIYLSFGYPESFGLPAAEAIACGCTVIGYPGFGGSEFFDAPSVYPVPEADIFSFIRIAEKVIDDYRMNPGRHRDNGIQSSRAILEKYTPARERAELAQAWNSLLS